MATPLRTQDALSAFVRVFRSADAFDAPFRPELPKRLLWYPSGYSLDSEDYAALRSAAKAIGDTGFVMTMLDDLPGYPPHLYFDSSEEDAYRMLTPSENALYSPNGRWGVIFSTGDFAVLGGSADFIAAIGTASRRDSDAEAANLAADWRDEARRGRADADWLEPLLAHLRGDDAIPS